MIKQLRDGHIHSPYCPHGTSDSMESYVEKALECGLKEISFTEHMPFPCYFIEDRKFQDACAPSKKAMEEYFKETESLKKKYKNEIKINIGMEVDYLDGLEEKTRELLDLYGSRIEDSLLSVHFIKFNDELVAIDGIKGFQKALDFFGSLDKVYDRYYQTLLKAIRYDFGEFKPKRIGHPNLIRRFCELYPFEYKNYDLLEEIVKEIKERNYEVDVNTAGLRKEHCGEIYVSGKLKELIEKYNVKKVYGSDSHTSGDVGRDFDKE